MLTQDATILVVPGLGNSEPDHWQSRWQAKLSTAQRVEQDDWTAPDFEKWTKRIADAILASDKPVILLAHSLGVLAAVHAVQQLVARDELDDKIAGAFLVAPPSEDRIASIAAIDPRFAPIPTAPLPFPSVLVASRDDIYSSFGEAEDMAYAWGSAIADAGSSGHINVASGYGPWPEGLMRFASFMKKL